MEITENKQIFVPEFVMLFSWHLNQLYILNLIMEKPLASQMGLNAEVIPDLSVMSVNAENWNTKIFWQSLCYYL